MWRLSSLASAAWLIIAAPAAAAQPDAILIYGGFDHTELLGCLTCAADDIASVWNPKSRFGWGNPDGAWTLDGAYKSRIGKLSACNPQATEPPRLRDSAGQDHGVLSTGTARPDSICGPAGSPRLCLALKAMCADDN